MVGAGEIAASSGAPPNDISQNTNNIQDDRGIKHARIRGVDFDYPMSRRVNTLIWFMNSQLAKRIKNVMSAVFELSADEITDHSSPDTIWSWDSLKHMNLVSALEEEFDISFTDSEILEMMNFPLIKLIISEKISLLFVFIFDVIHKI